MRNIDTDKEQAIYQAALRLIQQEGFAGLKMSILAKEAQMAAGTIYLYFKSKEDLINQLYITLKRRSAQALMKGYDASAPFMESFELIWQNFLDANLANPEESAFVEQYYRSPYLDKTVQEEADQLVAPIFELLERGKRERLVKDVPTEMLVAQLTGFVNGLAQLHASGNLRITENFKTTALAMAWDGLKR
ncbi:MAG: TetR/AcrR family transcriptional regulator [Saprospiraceae bacterium]|nr:TetR/AcrR family transcriptional regulator [Saprospiraceae bacterium]MDZ4705293.1 TetR/AcrR family transcriptional regulator [Saprospiraceae bacterium]